MAESSLDKKTISVVYLDTNALVKAGVHLDADWFQNLLIQSENYDIAIIIPELVLLERVNQITEKAKELSTEVEFRLRQLKNLTGNEYLISEQGNWRTVGEQSLKVYYKRIDQLGITVLPNSHPEISELITRAVFKKAPFTKSGKGFQDAIITETITDNIISNQSNSNTVVVTEDKAVVDAIESWARLHAFKRTQVCGCEKVAELIQNSLKEEFQRVAEEDEKIVVAFLESQKGKFEKWISSRELHDLQLYATQRDSLTSERISISSIEKILEITILGFDAPIVTYDFKNRLNDGDEVKFMGEVKLELEIQYKPQTGFWPTSTLPLSKGATPKNPLTSNLQITEPAAQVTTIKHSEHFRGSAIFRKQNEQMLNSLKIEDRSLYFQIDDNIDCTGGEA